mmetsp:Transcript_102727/g.182025  ORF Transcript_102727/g.182025 Transcript_102727/m.182025 type:complete len:312 (-) Transcript_102727:58-993(-)
MLCSRLVRAERVEVFSSAYSHISDLCREIDDCLKSEDDKLLMDACREKEEWRRKLQECIVAFMRWEHVAGALKSTAPAAYEARHADGLQSLTVDQVRALRDELQRRKVKSEEMSSGCSGLVRALKELYLAESVEDALKTLACQTADQEALQQLSVRSKEFAEALIGLRSQAIDFEFFKHLAEDQDCESASDRPSDVSEASDGGAAALEAGEDAGNGLGKREPQPVRLPQGWKLQWVKGKSLKSKDKYRFLDPAGRKYTSVWELRAALVGGAQAVEAARQARQLLRGGPHAAVGVRRSLRKPSRKGSQKRRW